MNLDINQVFLLGTISGEPGVSHTNNGTPIAKFRIQIVEPYKTSDGEYRESKSTHNCIMWGKRGASLIDTIAEGSRVIVKGKIENRSYKDQYGNDKWVTQINVSNAFAVDGAHSPPTSGYPNPEPQPQVQPQVQAPKIAQGTNRNEIRQTISPTGQIETHDDDLPF